MKLWAKNNRLYFGKNRVGQVIIHTFINSDLRAYEEAEELIDDNSVLYGTDFMKISETLVIDSDRFYELLNKGDFKTLVSLPLLSSRYFPKWLLPNLKPITFDFIQVEGKLLIFADGDNVRIIGDLDDETAYHLLYNGLILSDEQVVKGINYAYLNGLPLRDINNELFSTLNKLKSLMDAGFVKKIKNIRIEKGKVVITTSSGIYYGTKTILTNDDYILSVKLPFKSGTIIRVSSNVYVAINYELDDSKPLIWVELNKNSVPSEVKKILNDEEHLNDFYYYIKVGDKKVLLKGHLSLLTSTLFHNKKEYNITLPKTIKIINKPKLVKKNKTWAVSYKVLFSFAGITLDYYDSITAMMKAGTIHYRQLKFYKLNNKLSDEKYKMVVKKIVESEFFSDFILVSDEDTYLWYKVNNVNFTDGIIYVIGYGVLPIEGTVIKDEFGNLNLIVKTERNTFKVYKIVRLDNVFKRQYIGNNYMINVKADKLTLSIVKAISQLLAVVNTVPLKFNIEVGDSNTRIVINDRKIFVMPTNSIMVKNIKNTFLIFDSSLPNNFTLPIEHEIVKNFMSLIIITGKSGYWFLGKTIENPQKTTFINYRFFNGEKRDKPLFIGGVFEIAGIRIKPSDFRELENFSVQLSDLFGETVIVPILKNRSLLQYI